MPRYIFKKEKDLDNKFDTTAVEITVDTESLPNILMAFEEFLKGSGFSIRGTLEIVEDEE